MKKSLYTLLICAILSVSCESWLEVKPKDALPGSVILSTLSGVEGLLLGAYDNMQSSSLYGRNMICTPEILADNCGLAQGGYMYRDDYRNIRGSGCNIWTYAYEVIAITNDIIDAIDKIEVDGSDADRRDRIKGEALFIRGLLYFDLLRSYAREPGHLMNNFDLGVPLVTEPFVSMGPDAYPERTDIFAVWQQVETDLNASFALLDGKDVEKFYIRANSYAAKALLARAFLYQSKWTEAVDAAGWVISQNKVSIHNGDYKDIYTNGVESLLELRFAAPEAMGSGSLHAVYGTMDDGYRDADGYGNGQGSGEGELIIAENLRILFEAGDKRTEMMRKAYFAGGKVWWSTKFNSWQGSFGQDNVPLIRDRKSVV